MIIPAQTLRQIKPVDPFYEKTIVNGRSFGLSSAGYDIRVAQDIVLPRRGFALASSMEHFNMPNDILGIVHDKSTWARQGLAVQNTVIEAGWRGYLTLELSNGKKNRLEIKAGDPIAQIVFHRLEAPTEQPYSGKYQDQKEGPQEAIFEFPTFSNEEVTGSPIKFNDIPVENDQSIPFTYAEMQPEFDQPLHTVEQFETLMYKWIGQKAQILWQASGTPTTDRPYYPIIAACGQHDIDDVMTEAVRRGILKSTVIQVPTGIKQELTPHTMYYWGKGEYA